MSTWELFCKALTKNTFVTLQCPFCHDCYGFYSVNGKVYYKNGCHCSSYPTLPFEVDEEYFNDLSLGHTVRIDSFIDENK